MSGFRAQVGRATGLEERNGELITAGIAGSIEPEFTVLIAELDGARYAISGEIAAAVNTGGEPYAVNLIVVDAERDRSTDLITVPLDPTSPAPAVQELAAAVAVFTSAAVELPRGDAALFVSSEPGEAQVFVDGVSIGRTSQLDVAMLAPGRYRLEVRKEGFLPDTRMIEVRAADTTFVHVVMTAISGGSIQVAATPRANVLLDGVPSGTTPVALSALPGTHRVTLQRDGFEEETFEVLVRNYLVSRLEATLTPAVNPLVYWSVDRLSEQLRASHRKLDEVEPGAFRWRNLRDRFDERLADARREGAESMRERAAAHVDAEGDRLEARAESHPPGTIDEERAIVCYRLADEIRALPLAAKLDEVTR